SHSFARLLPCVDALSPSVSDLDSVHRLAGVPHLINRHAGQKSAFYLPAPPRDYFAGSNSGVFDGIGLGSALGDPTVSPPEGVVLGGKSSGKAGSEIGLLSGTTVNLRSGWPMSAIGRSSWLKGND